MAEWWEEYTAQPAAQPASQDGNWWDAYAADFGNVESGAESRPSFADVKGGALMSAAEDYRRRTEAGIRSGEIPLPLDPSAVPLPQQTRPERTGWDALLELADSPVSRAIQDNPLIRGFAGRVNEAAAGANLLTLMPIASAVDAVRGDNMATDFAGSMVQQPRERAAALMPSADASAGEKLISATGGLAFDLPSAMLIKPLQAANALPRFLAATDTAVVKQLLGDAFKEAAMTARVPATTAGLSTALSVIDSGGTPEEAIKAGLADAGGTVGNFVLPLNIAGGIASRGLQGAAVNVVGEAAQNTVTNQFLPDELQRPLYDPEQLGISAVLGAPMAIALGERAPRSAPQTRARELTNELTVDASRIRTPESDAVDAGRETARAIFAEADAAARPDPATIDPERKPEKTAPTRLAELEAKPEPTLFEREEMALLQEGKPFDRQALLADLESAPEPELIRNGTRVFYPGDVKAMRAKLAEAGLSEGMRMTGEDGSDAGLYFPARLRAEVDAVLRPKPAEQAQPEPVKEGELPYRELGIPPPRKPRNRVKSAADFDPNYHDIRDFIALHGGLDAKAFAAEFNSEVPSPAENFRFFGKPLFRKSGGLQPDQLRELLQETGFLNPDSMDGVARYTPQDAYDLVDRALDGNPVYHSDGVETQNAIQNYNNEYADLSRRQEYIDEHGVTPELDEEFARRADAMDRGDLEPVFSKRAKDRTATPDMFGATQRAQTTPTPRPASGDLFGAPTPRDRLDAAQRDSDARLTGPAVGMRQGDGELFAGPRPRQETIPPRSSSAPSDPTSWILRDKATGKAVMETADRRKVDALNTQKYEAVPAEQHMQEVNTKGTLAYDAARGSGIKRSQRPAERILPVEDMRTAPLGAWVRGNKVPGVREADLFQVMDVPLDRINAPELDSSDNIAPERRLDAEDYTNRLRNGEVAPNARGYELPSGLIKLADGHRRMIAARNAGRDTLRIAVSPIDQEGVKQRLERPDAQGIEVDEATALTPAERASFERQTLSPDDVSLADPNAGYVDNASGESTASVEAQNRLKDEKAAGQTRALIDRDGTVSPLIGVDSADAVARAGQIIVQRGIGKDEWTVLSHGSDVPRPVMEGRINRARSDLGALAKSESPRVLRSTRKVDPQTETPAFKKWFGDSKVVDASGEPLVVYHGTKADFDVFETSRQGIHLGTEAQANIRNGKRTIAAYLSAKKLRRVKDQPGGWERAVKSAKGAGFDGIVYLNRFEGIPSERFASLREQGWTMDKIDAVSDSQFRKLVPEATDSYIAFRPEQIKSATGNSGAFDATNPSILKSAAKQKSAPRRLSDGEVKQAKADAESRVASHWGRSAVNKLKTRGRVEFITKQEVVDRGLQTMAELDGVDGFFDPESGKAYVIVDSGAQSADLPGVLSHEVFHANAEQFLGSDGFKRLKEAFRKLKNRDKDIEAAYKRVPGDTAAAHVDEEGLAYLAQEAPKHRLSERLTDEAKLFLNRLGIPLDWLNAHAAAVRKIAALNLKDAGNRGRVAWFTKDGVKYQKAFHGTPHRDIEKSGFKLNKIGTGEGAQAYGWGIYFAGQKDVAEHYRRALAKFDIEFPDGTIPAARDLASRFVEGADGDKGVAMARLSANRVDDALLVERALAALKKATVRESGQLYHAEIPEDSDLLDWDKPLSEQPEKVRAALLRSVGDLAVDGESFWERDLQALDAFAGGNKKVFTGADLYADIIDALGSRDSRAASEYLNTIGIPGLRYRDGGSRGQGQMSYQDGLPAGFKYEKDQSGVGIKNEKGLWLTTGHRSEADAHRNLFGPRPSHNYVIWDETLLTPEKAQITPYYSKRVADTPQTETENFKRWSDDAPLVKAADADEYKFKPGKKVVAEGFHGTASPFDAFDDAKRGSATGAKSAAAGHWLVSSPEVAVGYAHYAALNAPIRVLQERAEFLERKAQRSGRQSDWDAANEAVEAVESMDSEINNERLRGQNVIKAFVSLKNPAVFDAGGDSFVDIADDINKFIRDAKREGRDGVVFTNLDDDPGFNDRQATHYLAFKPTQIKSAIGNNGDFDGSKPSILASKRTRQDAEKDEEPTPRFNSATEFWTDNIGKPLFNTISRATKAVIANDFLKRHGLNLAEDMPPEAQKAWRAYKQDVGNLKKTVSEIADEAKKLTPEERAMVSDLVEREMKAGVTPPEAVVRMATLMTSIMRKQSQQLVETGMLSKDAADRWEGRYLPRFYQKHLLTNPFDAMLRKAYLSGIKGTHLKGRGLFETIPVEDVPAYEKMGWEVRDPERGKKPDLKGLPEGSKVRVWRDFTPAERQKMGEVRDAMYRFARGYTDTQIDIAKGKLFDHIARTVARDDNPGGSYVLVPDTSVPGTGVKKFGNLAGKYVPGDVLSALKTKAGPDSDITRAYLKALSLWKEGRTSLNPVTHVNNVVSNLVMSDLAGVNLVDPRSWKLYADTFNDYRKEGTWFKEAQKAGMFGGEWYGNEVAQWLPLPSELKDSGPRSIPGKFAMKAVDAIGSVRRGMGKMYQAEDQFFKLLLYKQARERGLEPNDAVTWAEKFVFDYSTAAPGVTKLKNTLFPFANYSSKAVPALTFAATHYPWRIAKWIGLLSGFSLYAFNTLYGDDEAEEMAESEAAMMPDYLKGRSSFFGVPKAIRLPYDDESTGDGMYVDISRFVPLGDLFDAENQSGGVPLPAPLTPNNPIITTAIAMLANKDSFTGKDIVRESDTSGEAAQKRIGWLYRQMAPNNPLVPGSYNFNRIGQAVSAMAGEPIGPYTGLDYNGNTISPGRALAQTFGIKLRSVDFEKEMDFQIYDLKREISDLKGQKTKLKKNQSISDETLESELDKLDVKIEAVRDRLANLQDIPIPQR